MRSSTRPSAETLRRSASLFSRPIFRGLAANDAPQWAERHSANIGYLRPHLATGQNTVADLFECAYALLRRHYRIEHIYKAEIIDRIVFGRHSVRSAGVQVELPVGSSIADLAIANGTTTAYEIKTALDSPRRLPSQTRDYLRVFDRVYVVTFPESADALAAVTDERVGILLLTRQGSLREHRAAASNLLNLSVGAMFRCLRRSEYLPALEHLYGPITVPNGRIAAECEKTFARLHPADAHSIFCRALRARTTGVTTVDFVQALPRCLRALGFATPLSQVGRLRVLNSLALPL